MKRIYTALFAGMLLAAACVTACNNPGKNPALEKKERTPADTLTDAVNEGHNIGMARMGQLTRAQQQTLRLLDSIAKLPAKARQAAIPYKARLQNLLQDLDHAELSMNKWMNEYKWDSTFASVKEKISYLQEEKEKVNVVKDAILSGLQKADSVLQRKF
jgi:hypothetical protein